MTSRKVKCELQEQLIRKASEAGAHPRQGVRDVQIPCPSVRENAEKLSELLNLASVFAAPLIVQNGHCPRVCLRKRMHRVEPRMIHYRNVEYSKVILQQSQERAMANV